MARVEYLPVRHRRLGVFFAPDPNHGDVHAEWNLESYRLLPRGTRVVRARVGSSAPGVERLAIKSEEDGEPRFLPDVLALLHRGGEVPAEALPGLLHLLGPGLGRRPRDYEPILARSGAWRVVGLLGLLVLAVLALAGASLFLPTVRHALGEPTGRTGRGVVMLQGVNGPAWLASPMRADTFLTTSDFVPALGTAVLPGGYWPPRDRFNPPPPPGSDLNPPGFTLARVAARPGGVSEERLVLCNSYERSLLPRVLLRGEVVPLADLALPAATLDEIGRGARNLNPTLVLCQNVTLRNAGPAVEWIWIVLAISIVGSLMVLTFTIPGLLIWRRQANRRRQVRELRAKLGLPEPVTVQNRSR